MKPLLSLESSLLLSVLVVWLALVAIDRFYKLRGGMRPQNLQQQLRWERAHRLGRKKFVLGYGLLLGLFLASSGLVSAYASALAVAVELPALYGAAVVASLLPAGPWWMARAWHLTGHGGPPVNAEETSEVAEPVRPPDRGGTE